MIPTSAHDTTTGAEPAEAQAFAGRDELRAWIERLLGEYADQVHWSAPRRGLHCTTRAEVAARLQAEWRAMDQPSVCVLRRTSAGARRFHEYTIRFRLAEPGIDGVRLPIGADVELERLRVSTHDQAGRIVAETCIETWTWLSATEATGSPER